MSHLIQAGESLGDEIGESLGYVIIAANPMCGNAHRGTDHFRCLESVPSVC